MARIIEVTVPAARTTEVLELIGSLEDVVGVQLQQGASMRPPADVIRLTTTNRSQRTLVRMLDEAGVFGDGRTSVTISEPAGIIAPAAQEAIENDESDVIWEEMEFAILRESNMGPNGMLAAGRGGGRPGGLCLEAAGRAAPEDRGVAPLSG
jgi:hypothetical protein